MLEHVEKVVGKAKPKSLGLEASSLTWSFAKNLEETLSKVELVATDGLVEQLREIKDKDEIAEIREAVEIAERAFGVAKAGLRGDQTEKQVADELERRLFGRSVSHDCPRYGSET